MCKQHKKYKCKIKWKISAVSLANLDDDNFVVFFLFAVISFRSVCGIILKHCIGILHQKY